MKTDAWVYWAPKKGNTAAEYQDAFSPRIDETPTFDSPVQRFAVADGATEAIYSGLWAELLVTAWVEQSVRLFTHSMRGIKAQGEKWLATVSANELPWWAESKVETGSFATLLGLELRSNGGAPHWRYAAVGDSCCFLLREGTVEKLGPLTSSEEFSNSPYLIPSKLSDIEILSKSVVCRSSTLHQLDQFLLMTDALALYATQQMESGVPFVEWFPFLENSRNNSREFETWVESARSAGSLKNDDVTLVVVEVVET